MGNSEGQPGLSVSARHVLVVDDDAELRASAADLLREAGFRVEEAPDGRPALARLRASRARLVVLLDFNMPGMDGMELLRVVGADEMLASHHAYLLMTAQERTLPLEFVNLLTQLRVSVVAKPFDIDTLVGAVEHAAQRLVAGS